MNSVYAWHFLDGDKLSDGRKAPKDGEWLTHEGPVRICSAGLHASRDPFDALQHAPGEMLCLVECQDIRQEHEDKFVCVRRRIVARFDAAEMLRHYARLQALEATKYWEPPEVVADYLNTGDERIRDAAWDAWDAARAAARAAAWAAARAAARASARIQFRDLVYECFEGPMAGLGLTQTHAPEHQGSGK